jgi:hypothetical protein
MMNVKERYRRLKDLLTTLWHWVGSSFFQLQDFSPSRKLGSRWSKQSGVGQKIISMMRAWDPLDCIERALHIY